MILLKKMQHAIKIPNDFRACTILYGYLMATQISLFALGAKHPSLIIIDLPIQASHGASIY